MGPIRPIEDLLAELIELKEPAEREAYLNNVCGEDTALRGQLQNLLAAHKDAGSFFQDSSVAATADAEPDSRLVGSTIGPFKLREVIGEGGMGTVYVAEQNRPLRRKVALKVIKPGMDSKAIIARFEAERNALALMNHPNIAKVLDAGTTEQGRPYFAMELVAGIPITEYCDTHKLTIDERLRLFVQVCEAIQHAHQKGIIHRDIKPSNVLVTELDGKPVPKVIDFGVAKALNQSLSDHSIYTTFQSVIGTPLYMSPEQASLSAVDVDTRSDVYSLGVLLYELLTGTTPFERHKLEMAAQHEMLRVIREEEPPRPSNRISTLGETAARISQLRQTHPDRLGRIVTGDLDWIVMTALAKERSRRYESPSRLALDVQNYLRSDPVAARPPTLRYRAGNYIKRHRAALAVTGVLISCLLAVLTASVYSARVAHRHLAELEARRQTLLEIAMEQATLLAWQGDLQNAQRKLDAARAFGAAPSWCALLEGQIKLQEGKYDEARQLLLDAQKQLPHSTVAKSLLTICEDFAGFEHQYLLEVGGLKDWPANTFEDYLFRGLAQTQANPHRAVQDLEEALRQDANSAVVHHLLGSALRLLAVDTTDPRQAYQFARRAAYETLVATALLPENSFALAEYIHARAVLANLCAKLGPQYEQERRDCIDQAQLAVERSRTLPAYGLLVHKARIFFCNQFGTREEETAESFNYGPADPSQSEQYSDIIFRRSWLKYVGDDLESARSQFDSFRGRFAHRTNLTFPAVIDMTAAPDSGLQALQQKYAPLLSQPGRDELGIFAHHDWAVARLLKLDVVAQQRGLDFRNLCRSLPLDIAAMHEPLAAYMSGEIDSAIAEARIRTTAQSNRVLAEAYFALAVGQLADGNRAEAKRLFEACISTDYYEFFVYWWSQAFLERVDDDQWLPWLTRN